MSDDDRGAGRTPPRSRSEDEEAAAARIRYQASWVDLQLRQAMQRGEFDELPGFGKPIQGLTGEHDPDWWVKRLVEREQITGVLPPSLLLRKEDALLDGRLDALGSEAEVRREVAEFNDRVRWALYRPPEGPPMITQQRDPDAEVARWRDRRASRVAAQAAAQPEPGGSPTGGRPRRRWLPRLPRRRGSS